MKIGGIIEKQKAIDKKMKIHIHASFAKGRYNNPGSNSGDLGISAQINLSVRDGTKDNISLLS